MKTQEVKDHLQSMFAWTGEWKRIRKWKDDDGRVMRSFQNSALPGAIVAVNSGKSDDGIGAVNVVFAQGIPASALTSAKAKKGYYYQLSNDADMIEGAATFDSQGNIVDAEHMLTIGSQPTFVDDGPYAAQQALEPLHKSTLGRDAIDEMEGTFFLAPGEAAKLEPELVKNGWQKGHW